MERVCLQEWSGLETCRAATIGTAYSTGWCCSAGQRGRSCHVVHEAWFRRAAAAYMVWCSASSITRALHYVMQRTRILCEQLRSHGCPVLGPHPAYLANASNNDSIHFLSCCASAISLMCISARVAIWPHPEPEYPVSIVPPPHSPSRTLTAHHLFLRHLLHTYGQG